MQIIPLRPLTTHQVAQFCAVTIPGVIRWVKAGKLKAYTTPGGHRRIRSEDLLAFMQRYGMPIPEGLSLANRNRVLIVDDDPGILHMIRRTLSKIQPPLEIETAADGFDAGQKSVVFLPHIVLLDLRLPGIDGFQVCENLKKNPKTSAAKIIAMTGADTPQARRKILDRGADAYLPKPFELRILIEEISRLLGIRLEFGRDPAAVNIKRSEGHG
ncbi:MAG: response regulator [Elusimicrobia bacterium]|nr:response regulator [Elusimicrobiota bacterium]